MHDYASSAKDGDGERVASVRLLKSPPPYRQGEVAGFPLEIARKMVMADMAEYVVEVEREIEKKDGRKVRQLVWERSDKPNTHVPAFSMRDIEDVPNKMQTASVKK